MNDLGTYQKYMLLSPTIYVLNQNFQDCDSGPCVLTGYPADFCAAEV